MSNHDRRSEWTVLAGIGLVLLGIWLFLGTFASPLIQPIAIIIGLASRVIWPLILIALGVMLVLRARGGGWSPSGRPLYRSRTDRMIAGVLGGASTWLGVNPTPLRVVFAFLTFFTGIWPGVFLYILATVLVPDEPFGAPTGYSAPVPPAPSAPPAPPVPPAPTSTSPAPPEPPAPPVAPVPVPEPPAAPAAPPVPPAPPAS
jgi:phage shock protein PspC (stress-responsive transcriptional regulator)